MLIPGRTRSGRLCFSVIVAAGALILAGCSSASNPSRSVATAGLGPSTQVPSSTPTDPSTTTTVASVSIPAGGPVPAGFRSQSATFVSADQGWVLGTAPCAKAPCTSIVRTNDDGATWAGTPAPTDGLENPESGSNVSQRSQ